MSVLHPDALQGRTVLVTGASRGIGAATATALGAAGAHVAAHWRTSQEDAAAALAAVPADRLTLLQADMERPGAARDLWREAVAWRGRVDVLVVNAAALPQTPMDGDDRAWDAGWEQAMRVNVLEPAALIREAVAHFIAHGGGTIVVLSSWAAQQGSRLPELTAYAASKAAIRSLAQTVARNHARDGIRVHVVAPGVVRTEMAATSDAGRGGSDAVDAGLAMGRRVEPSEVADLIAFLATDAAPSLTGGTIDLNGASYVR
ncbi:SDR family NAD(P)-dependent oxidoreductase [Patulibacter sp.]|uniref:SDR family NAD(P)-dependent oxidoreductase n=1 Tax=Patulibacter sp. TaxID=1912859 RepID=UPI002724A44B|nr:SDR family oxidoreductase [Patulibacter sp.]MDO9407368.1 SDR family oxidoreductase [Patulibacter sp.]